MMHIIKLKCFQTEKLPFRKKCFEILINKEPTRKVYKLIWQ